MARIKRRISRVGAILFGLVLVVPFGACSDGGHDGKVTVNHNGKLIRVGPLAAAYHVLVHGDTIDGDEEPPAPPGGGAGGGY